MGMNGSILSQPCQKQVRHNSEKMKNNNIKLNCPILCYTYILIKQISRVVRLSELRLDSKFIHCCDYDATGLKLMFKILARCLVLY